jgi:multidrug efflux pump subunit AcrA (membrane-fusion protein)
MNYTSGLLSGIGLSVLVVGTGLGVWLLLAPKPEPKKEKPASPATVAKTFDEANAVTVTPEADKVMSMKFGKVERKPMPRHRLYGGEVMVAGGHTALASTPLAGTVRAPMGGMPLPGQKVQKGQTVLQLVPILTPEARATLAAAQVDADGQVKSTKATADAAKLALDRARRLFNNDAGSKRMVEEAEAAHEIAQKTYDAAVARRKLLTDVLGEAGKGNAKPLEIKSPEDGTLRALSVLPGQAVPAGASLFEVVDLAQVWVRVPVYAAELGDIDRAGAARVTALSAAPGDTGAEAKPATAPPSATPLAGTIDLYYSLDNSETHYSPGHRVAVLLPLKGEAKPLTVPRGAVLYDYYGGAWVYEKLKKPENTFVRRRVVVRYTVGDTVVLDMAPPKWVPGKTEIVTARAAELFGTESGFTK